MEVRIGVIYTPKEISIEVDSSPDDLIKAINAAMKDDDAMVWLNDISGRKVGIPSKRLAYVEIPNGLDSDRFNPSGAPKR